MSGRSPFARTSSRRGTSQPISYAARLDYAFMALGALGVIMTAIGIAFIVVSVQSHHSHNNQQDDIQQLRDRIDDLEAEASAAATAIASVNTTVNSQNITCSSGSSDTTSPYYFASDLILLYTFKELEGTQSQDLSEFGTPVHVQDGPDSADWNWRYPCGIRSQHPNTVWRTGDGTGTDNTADKITDAIKLSGEYSIEIWLQTHDTSQSGPARIMSIGSGGAACSNDDTAIMLGQNGDNFVWRLPVNPSSCNEQVITNSLNSNHLPMQFVVTFNGTTAKIYHNGQNNLTATVASGIGTWTSNYELSLFNSPWLLEAEQRPWDGIIHKLAIWNRALTQSEVITTFKSGPCYPRACNCNSGCSLV